MCYSSSYYNNKRFRNLLSLIDRNMKDHSEDVIAIFKAANYDASHPKLIMWSRRSASKAHREEMPDLALLAFIEGLSIPSKYKKNYTVITKG